MISSTDHIQVTPLMFRPNEVGGRTRNVDVRTGRLSSGMGWLEQACVVWDVYLLVFSKKSSYLGGGFN